MATLLKAAPLATTFPDEVPVRQDEISKPLHWLPFDEAIRGLRELDWAFTDADTRLPGHDIHPYPAKFIPQIPAHLITRLTSPGELVCDPFGGSGTTALEALRNGRRAISLDANPLAELIGRAKTARLDRLVMAELHALHGALSAELDLPLDANELIRTHKGAAPTIAHRDKWFADSAFSELLLIKSRVEGLESQTATILGKVALSRMVLQASFQDSETRYKSVPREVLSGETLRRFLKELQAVLQSITRNEHATRFGVAAFHQGDARHIDEQLIPSGSVDFVVTSPPYGNATDYHLYHRFRLLWLGFDPIALGKIEIGSHLKHQREASGFESYYSDLEDSVRSIARILRPGRYAALVLGDSVYKGVRHDPALRICNVYSELGFDGCEIIEREVHATKRSFTHAGRRATHESLVVLRKALAPNVIRLTPPPYKLWPYEAELQVREATTAAGSRSISQSGLAFKGNAREIDRFNSLVFTHTVCPANASPRPTWQSILENGSVQNPTARKDPKYATHGLHPYKGKFYPQLAKALLNLANVPAGSTILDPFCGSGTTLLEGYLNGYRTVGMDMNPLAAKIARAKVGILNSSPEILTEVVSTVFELVDNPPRAFSYGWKNFPDHCADEIERWFARPIANKLDWLLSTIRRSSAGVIQDFLEIVLSSIIREVSNQDPADLRIRYRKAPLNDADVLGLFLEALALQFGRVQKFWEVRGYAPRAFRESFAASGDNRNWDSFEVLGLSAGSVDAVVTSPPYATALPYIDTDRLSILLLFGLNGSDRRPLESGLTGSREIGTREKAEFEGRLEELTPSAKKLIQSLQTNLKQDTEAGFRKQNGPSLLSRYFIDMKSAISNVYDVCRPNAEAMFVVGDNRTQVGGREVRIPTTELVEEIAIECGFRALERIDITVTTEGLVHQKNAITQNCVLRLRR